MSHSRRVAWPGLQRLGGWLFLASITAMLTLSAQGLAGLGIPYDAPWGPMPAKIHPSSYLLVLAALAVFSAHGHPMRVAGGRLREEPLIAVYLACIVFICGYSVMRHGPSGAAFMIDTLVMPAVAVLVFALIPPAQRTRCLVLMLALLSLNALLGLGEGLAKRRVITMTLAGQPEIIEDIFRPSAPLGHPLTNAIITAALLPTVLYLRTSTIWRAALAIFLWVALLAFGGRTSFLLASLVFGGCGAAWIALRILQGRVSYLQITGGALAGIVSVTVLTAGLAISGIGERIFKSLHWDSSAAVRARIWDVFDFMSETDLWFGVPPSGITELIRRLGLTGPGETIENFWLYMFLQLGAVGFLPFLLGIGCMLAWIWKEAGMPMRLSMLVFFATASSSNSLASKSVSLVVLCIAVLATRHRQGARAPSIQLTKSMFHSLQARSVR